jgi:hypothetical protein
MTVGVAVSVMVAVAVSVEVATAVSVEVGVCVAVGSSTKPGAWTSLVSSVTVPLMAYMLPSAVEPDVTAIDSHARIYPAKSVPVPRVAELPISQKTFAACAPLLSFTSAAVAVVRVLPIWMKKTPLELPDPSRVTCPVSWADESKQKIPGVSVNPPRSWPVRFVPHNCPPAEL